MNEPTKLIIGIAFYDNDNWLFLKKHADDPEFLDNTYQEWQQGFEKGKKSLSELGREFNIINIDVRELIAWCNANHCDLDGKARAQFCAQKNQQMWKS